MGSRSKDRAGYEWDWPYGHASPEVRRENREAWTWIATAKNQRRAKRKARAIRKRIRAAQRGREKGVSNGAEVHVDRSV